MKEHKKTIAIYPGSFDPFHKGHYNILEKAENIFGKENVIVAIGLNPDKIDPKTYSLINNYDNKAKEVYYNSFVNNRVEDLKKRIPSKNIDGYVGFLTDYVRKKEEELNCNIVVIRGLRNGYDFDYEYNAIRYMWDQLPNMNVVCIFTDPAYSHISSSAYRALEKVRPGSGHYLLKIE